MTHDFKNKGFIGKKTKRREIEPGSELGFIDRLRTVNQFHLGSALLQIITGLMIVGLSILGLVYPSWLAAVMSILGSLLTMSGAGLFYASLKDHHSVGNLVRKTIHRVIHDQN